MRNLFSFCSRVLTLDCDVLCKHVSLNLSERWGCSQCNGAMVGQSKECTDKGHSMVTHLPSAAAGSCTLAQLSIYEALGSLGQ